MTDHDVHRTDQQSQTAQTNTPWLTIVGIGEDGWEGLSRHAQKAVMSARVLAGGKRHLQMLPDNVSTGKELLAWPKSMHTLIAELCTRKMSGTCVLATGDPMHFGVGAHFAKQVAAEDMRIMPNVSTFALICARLAWSERNTQLLSACGRPVETLHTALYDGARIVLYSGGPETPHEAADLMRKRGFGPSHMTVFEYVGGPRENRIEFSADTMDAAHTFAKLNSIAINCKATPEATIWSTSPGLPDTAFDHDGQITKQEIRALTIARLSPRPQARLWDVGAGSGSVAIEWLRAAPHTRAFAIEHNRERAARILRNAYKMGVPHLKLVEGHAPEALEGLAPPDAIFIGGGLAEPGMIDTCWDALKPGGRLVGNAVTFESEEAVRTALVRYSGGLTRLEIGRPDAVGRFTAWRPALPIIQWAVTKNL